MTEYMAPCEGCGATIDIVTTGVIGEFSDCWCDDCYENGRSPY